MSSLSTQNCPACHKELPSGASDCSDGVKENAQYSEQSDMMLEMEGKDDGRPLNHIVESPVMKEDSGEVLALDASEFVCLDDSELDDADVLMPPPPAINAEEDSQDVSLDLIALEEDEVDMPLSSAADAQDVSFDLIAVDENAEQSDVPPPAPLSDVLPPPAPLSDELPPPAPSSDELPPPAPSSDVLPPPAPSSDELPPPAPLSDVLPPPAPLSDVLPPPAPSSDVLPPPAPSSDVLPPPAPLSDVLPPSAPLSGLSPIIDFDLDSVETVLPAMPLSGLEKADESNADAPNKADHADVICDASTESCAPSKSSVSFTVQDDAQEVSGSVQTFEINQETPDTNGQFYLNSDISVIPKALDKTSISADFALADTGVLSVPEKSDDHCDSVLEEDEENDKTAAYERPAFLDNTEWQQSQSEVIQKKDSSDDAESNNAELAENSESKANGETGTSSSEDDKDDTVIAPVKPVQQDTCAGLKAVPSRGLGQLNFGQSFAVSSSLQAKKQDSPALLDSETAHEQKASRAVESIDNRDEKKASEKKVQLSDPDKTDARIVSQSKEIPAVQSSDKNRLSSRSSEARKVSIVDSFETPASEYDTQTSNSFTLSQVMTIIILFVIIIVLILYIVYRSSLFTMTPLINVM